MAQFRDQRTGQERRSIAVLRDRELSGAFPDRGPVEARLGVGGRPVEYVVVELPE